MTFPACYRLNAITASALLLGISGCGFTPATPSPEPTSQAQAIPPAAHAETVAGTPGSAEVVPALEPSAESPPESNQAYRNPFRPPSIKTRTLLPQQAESADIRLLGIAKRDSQHIALLETSGDFHKAIVGDFVNDWEVLSVTESETTLRRGLEQMSLRIR